MIPLWKERMILDLLGRKSERIIALQVGVARQTVKAVRERGAASPKRDTWNHTLKLDRLLGEEGRKFVYIARDIVNLDNMRQIHHPLFASLATQARDAIRQLPIKPGTEFDEQEKEKVYRDN